MYSSGTPRTASDRGVRFPTRADLARALRTLNPVLSPGCAYRLASEITEANDAGSIEHAWALAAQALVWPATKERTHP